MPNSSKYSTLAALMIAAAAAIALILMASALSHHGTNYNQLASLQVAPFRIFNGGKSYNTSVYLAITASQQAQGYMNVSINSSNMSCNQRCGMLFPFGSMQYVCFWMKNTKFPIRQFWLKEVNSTANGTFYSVVKAENASPYNLSSICGTGNAVLELPLNYRIKGLNVSAIGQNNIFEMG
ncbi:MAG: DUF192 domain-containing protein [Candidatus Micrarchaeia archaeon]